MSISPILKELSLEAFAAKILYENKGVSMPLWLCTDDAIKLSMLGDLSTAYKSWVQQELAMAEERKRTNPFNNLKVTELKEGSSWDAKI